MIRTLLAPLLLALALLAPSSVTAQQCAAAGTPCGTQSGFSCCAAGSYCQPWEPNFYQCISVPSGCGQMETDADYEGMDLVSFFGFKQPSQCCDECKKNPACKVFVFINQWGPACYLKSGKGARKVLKGAVVGVNTITPTPTTTAPAPSTCSPFENGIDYYGNDVGNQPTADAAACCALCNGRSDCRAYTFETVNKVCYLKSAAANRTPGTNVISGTKLSATTAPPPPPPTTPAPTPTTPAPSTCPTLETNIDYYDNDLRQVNNVNQAGCCSACNSDAACVAFTYVPASSTCYLKSSTAGRRGATGTVSGVKASASVCPATEQDIDYKDNDLSNVNVASLADCCAACRRTAGCNTFTYFGGVCYLKTSSAGRVRLVGAVSGVITPTTPTPPPPTPTTPTPPPPTPTTPTPPTPTVPLTCPASIESNVDYNGADLKTVNGVDLGGCCSACNSDANCRTFTYYNGVCYLKSGTGSRVALAGAVSGGRLSACATVELNVDYNGGDRNNLRGVDQSACCAACTNDPLCQAFTYVTASRECYLKNANYNRIVGGVGLVSGTKTRTAAVAPGDWDTGRCGAQKRNVFYHGNDISGSERAFTTVGECCDHCRATSGCRAFTYFNRYGKARCLLKTGASKEKTGYGDSTTGYVASGVFN